jgi:histidinol-phosphate aminotransferase
MDFWDQSVLSAAERFDNLVILKTCSKAVGLAALRLGFAVAGTRITDVLRAVKSPYNTDSVSQVIGGIVLSEKTLVREMRDEIIKSRDFLLGELAELAARFPAKLKIFDSKTNFVFAKTPIAEQIHKELLLKSIAVRRLGDGLRITAGSKGENAALIVALKEILGG